MRPSTPRPRSLPRAGSLLACAALLSLSATAMAAPKAPASEVQARYEQDRAKCLSGETNQDKATCLHEAGAARDAAKQGKLTDGDTKYRGNAKARCDALSGDEAADCLARMKGHGTSSGSAQAGGILRETVTMEIKPAAPAASAASAP
jgi:hypothetical protein